MPVIRFASTVILLRETLENTKSGFQIYTIKRPETMKFLPGYTVFPGGAVDKDDTSENWHPFIRQEIRKYPLLSEQETINSSVSHTPDSIQNIEIAHIVAAIREVFEETGALICQAGPTYLTPQDLSPYRGALEKKETTFYEIINTLQIKLDTSHLLYIGNRLTPPNKVARFNTNFYITFVPKDIKMLPSLDEVASDNWLDPFQAQEMWEREEILCVNPTKECFKALALLSFQSLLLEARSS